MTEEASRAYSRSDRTERRYATRTLVVIVVVCVAAVGLCVLTRLLFGPVRSWTNVAILAGVAAATNLPSRLSSRRVNLSLLGVITLAATPLGVGAGIVVIVLASTLVQLGRVPKRTLAFNAGMSTCLGATGVLIYDAIGAPVLPHPTPAGTREVLHVAAGLLLADLVQLLMNAVLIGAIFLASRGVAIRETIGRLLRTGSGAYLASGLLALLIFVAWVPAEGGPLTLLAVGPSLWAARWALNREHEEDTAHLRVVDTLNAAMEIRHPGAGTHAANAARVAEWLAAEVGTGGVRKLDLALAGALLRLDSLAAEGPDPAPVAGAATQRPARALAGVDFLQHLLPVIEHRDDDPSVQEATQIVVVADAYAEARERLGDDANSRTAAYRSLLAAADGTYDPGVLAALGRLLERVDPIPQPMPTGPGAGS